ncbi:FAD-binding oxidoreductase [Pseudoxanthomonas wuyuanensis]
MPDRRVDTQRRKLMQALALAGAAGTLSCNRQADTTRIEDISRMEQTAVARVARPTATGEVQRLLGESGGPVSIGGARFSMGGQTALPGSLHLDMRAMNRLVRLDAAQRIVRVQAGMRWRDLQDIIDPHDLSVKVMQSYSNFTVGGSVSVNCHGRYLNAGPIAHTVRALQLVDGGGQAFELGRDKEPDLFAAAIGGYGGLGVITEVELELAPNEAMARHSQRLALTDYPAFFRERVQSDPAVIMHNADLIPPRFDRPLAISWLRTDAALTESRRLVPRGLDYGREQNLIWSASELPGGDHLRARYLTDRLLREKAVVMRNYEASLDTASLEPRTRMFSTYLLQEYFLPIAGFVPFVRRMAAILQRHRVNALNVSVRHSPADTVSLLKWAPGEVFSFVLYYKQRSNQPADRASAVWTRQLIDAALAAGGRYYLPYRLHASPAQFRQAYPEAADFARLKRRIDPDYRFGNRLWQKYLSWPEPAAPHSASA